MSLASKTGTILFVKNSGTYTATLQSDKGDLYQFYDGTEANPTNITPDFAASKPTIAAIFTNSLSATGTVRPNAVVWNFNGTPLAFDANGISTTQFNGEAGHFKRIDPAVNTDEMFRLQIVKNLVKAAGGASSTIQALATVATGSSSITLNAMLPISISKKTQSSNRVVIQAGDDKYFTLRTQNDSCILKAVAMSNGSEITTGLTYQWRGLVNGIWTDLEGKTQQTLTVTNAMVDTNGQFQVEIYQDGPSNSIGKDVQSVNDLSDPYDVIPNPSANEIVEGSNTNVTFSPVLVKRGSSAKVKDMTWFFSFFDAAGILLNPAEQPVATATGTLTYAMAKQADGPTNYYIQSKE